MSKKTRIKWNLDLELILIDIWQAKLNDLRKQKRNAHVYNEIAGMLKSSANYCEASSNINGNDIKNKICNLTQRYRNEKKVTGPSGGTRSTWVHFEQIHAILGSLPCNDFSLINESLNVSSEIQQINLDDGDLLVVESDDSGEDEINIETTAHENNYDSPSTSSASGAHPPSAPATFPVANTTKKNLKRKAQDNIDRELLREIKRSNDLSEKEAAENNKLRKQQMEILTVLSVTSQALLQYLQNH